MIRTSGRLGDVLEAVPRQPRLEEFETSEAYRSARWVARASCDRLWGWMARADQDATFCTCEEALQ